MATKKVLLQIIMVVVSLITAFIMQTMITERLMERFLFLPHQLALLIYIGAMVLQATVLYVLLRGILHCRLDRASIFILWSLYFLIVSALLFLRNPGFRAVNFNPLRIIYDVQNNPLAVYILIMNIVMFIPIGYLFKNKGLFFSFSLFCLLPLLIEVTQYILSLGAFDVGDMILNAAGCCLGYLFVGRAARMTKPVPKSRGSY